MISASFGPRRVGEATRGNCILSGVALLGQENLKVWVRTLQVLHRAILPRGAVAPPAASTRSP
jgi:hypothetical protein